MIRFREDLLFEIERALEGQASNRQADAIEKIRLDLLGLQVLIRHYRFIFSTAECAEIIHIDPDIESLLMATEKAIDFLNHKFMGWSRNGDELSRDQARQLKDMCASWRMMIRKLKAITLKLSDLGDRAQLDENR